ncbi:mannose-1-phosphate guanylyltransferase/mannose-6-phosphate isomerase [Thermovibrio guaymasensis]|uniref:mannose-1-phosphate guanylyltransferase n=1 Tax=Thermovibrio guaymasensis TaxID=240167 RepID=A0A420W693_9BACT|nr:mannose-1-phosphate guanylyltransferase/mannose-6-phosphate isomerase [Thermovibrio guaymasensis]RKQ60627.1 mannose-1-phosphate guanylyltransferase/mannose-6-phosphate isomerase [Thermovibrio guaymasensis]
MKAVILCGGNGTRLFPASRKAMPKQFLKIFSGKSLFQSTLKRTLLTFNEEDLIVVTNERHKFLVKKQIEELLGEKDFNNFIFEPIGRNTAPAIALASKFALERLGADEEEVIFIFPSDHLILPEEALKVYLERAKKIAGENFLVTFGVKPTKPETGYGYIEAGQEIGEGAFRVKRFHEKPNFEVAVEYLSKGNFFWNSGMFAFKIGKVLEEFRRHSPEIYRLVSSLSFEELLESFSQMPDISIDYAVMEKAEDIAVIPMDIVWSDLGSWDALYDSLKDKEGENVKLGQVIDIDTKGSFILADKRIVSTIGVEDLIVVDSEDFLLITRRGESQRVREVVKKLEKDEELRTLTEFHVKVFRPWGYYVELEKGKGFKVKKLFVDPGKALSLQLHKFRSEHWVVVRGEAEVLIEGENGSLRRVILKENESIYVPKGKKHKLINSTSSPLEIIEVQVGNYLGEDDIIRFDVSY